MGKTFLNGVTVPELVVSVLLLIAFAATPFIVHGLANPNPTQHYAAVYPSIATTSVAKSDGSFYVAGTFQESAISYGSAILADATSGRVQSPFPDTDDTVYAVITDGAGGWYIGGDFSRVGPLQRSGVAHINAGGTADAVFAPVISGFGSSVIYSLVLRNGILYVGGSLTGATFSGVPVTGIVALNPVDGSLAGGFSQPDISGPGSSDPLIDTLVVSPDGALLYVGGLFDTIGDATTRNNLVAFNAVSGATTSFDPNITVLTGGVKTLAVSADGATLFVGGAFTTVNGATPRSNLASFDTATSVARAGFVPDPDADVNTLFLDSTAGALYAGGTFTTMSGQPRNGLAAVDSADGSVLAFNPVNVNPITIFSVALTGDESTLYAVGVDGITGQSIAAAYNTTTSVAGIFAQSVELFPYTVALSNDEASVLIGAFGNHVADRNAIFPASAGQIIIHVLPSGTVDPAFFQYTNDAIYTLALSPDESTLYVGGAFTTVGMATMRNRLLALDAGTGATTSFDPNLDLQVYSLAVSSDGGTLYAGGNFFDVGPGTTRNKLAAFDTTTGVAIPTFDPNVDAVGGLVVTLDLTSDDSTLYAAGAFANVNGGTLRNNLAAFDTATGTATAFDPDVGDFVSAILLSPDESQLFAGGYFETVNAGATDRSRAAAFDTGTSIATGFAPEPNSPVLALVFGPDEVLYMGGDFGQVNGTSHQRIVAVNADTGTPYPGFTTLFNNGVHTLSYSVAGGLFAGGSFTVASNNSITGLPYVVTAGLAHFSEATPTPTPTPATPTPTSGGSGSSGGGFIPPPPVTTPVGTNPSPIAPALTPSRAPTPRPTGPSLGVAGPPPDATPTPATTSSPGPSSSPAPEGLPSVIDRVLGAATLTEVVAVTSTLIAAVSVGAIALSAIMLSRNLVDLVYLAGFAVQSLLVVIGVKRRAHIWGTVYDSDTKHAIPFSKIELTDANGRVVETRFADRDGRYGFLTGSKELQKSTLTVSMKPMASGYVFPPVRVPSGATDFLVYEHVYAGGPLTVEADSFLHYNIPMDRQVGQAPRFSEFQPLKSAGSFMAYLLNIAFWAGLVLVPLAYWQHPSTLNLVVMLLFLGVHGLRMLTGMYRPFGVVRDTGTKKAVPYALVTLTDQQGKRRTFAVSDEQGRYFMSLEGGTYQLQTYTPANISPQRTNTATVKSRSGWVRKDLTV